jgi:hypothetical protein
MRSFPLVAIKSFIEATRDSGYKSTSSALAELVDNAFEAQASTVEIVLSEDEDGSKRILVGDDGTGMPANVLQLALQFGGSTRFNSRRGTGRYGMGLPNGSLSQARRVDVFSWAEPKKIWSSYLDVDEIASGKLDCVPPPVRFHPPASHRPESNSGTNVVLTRCDRLTYRTIRAQVKRLHADLGRMFRQQLYSKKVIRINDELVMPDDPLFLREGSNRVGAEEYGPPLTYKIVPPGSSSKAKSVVTVRFALLPVEEWHGLSNEEKNKSGITKSAGVSVIRAGREIDYGWYFMGSKRKENYDDWWRCEVSFSPDLDELFGVTHTKQKINPSEALNGILVPDLERIARDLNAVIRKRYLAVREKDKGFRSEAVAERRDHLMQPLKLRAFKPSGTLGTNGTRLQYTINDDATDTISFYEPSLVRDRLKLALNRDHSFYKKIYEPLLQSEQYENRLALEHLQLMLLALCRAECALVPRQEKETMKQLRESWSNTLTAFLD